MNEALAIRGASSMAGSVDALFFTLLAISLAVALGIAATIVAFAIRYRAGSAADRSRRRFPPGWVFEATWIVLPLLAFLGFFGWGATLFVRMNQPPPDALEIRVVGKQWMWKAEHPSGAREIDALHVPRGRPVRLVMTSQDVIHSLYVPAFRVKKDVLPGRVTDLWFTATRNGVYHLFCSQYCGTDHGFMRGQVVVVDPADYARWAAGAAPAAAPVDSGRRLFERLRCAQCHLPDGKGVGPALDELYGRTVRLANEPPRVADENYLRDSILYPQSQLVAGYPPVMPTFAGQLDDRQLLDLISYIKSMSGAPPADPAAGLPGFGKAAGAPRSPEGPP